MKKNLFLFLTATIIVTNYCVAQNVSLQWVKTIGTPGSDVIQSQISRDATGNFYMYVYAQNGADLDFGAGTYIVTGSGFYLVKYDADGNFNWYLEVSGNFTIDKNGNVYISGTFDSNYDFDPGPGVTHITSAYYDFCIAKYSTDRNLLWVNDIKGADANAFVNNSGFVIDNEGNCYINGFIEGSIDFDPSPGVATLQGLANNNYFVAAYNTNGDYKWAFKIDAGNPTYESPGLSFGNNSVYMFGSVRNASDLDPGPGTFNITGNGIGNSFMARYDKSDGSFISGFVLTSTVHANYAFWLSPDSLRNIVMMGFYNGPIDIDPGPGVTMIPTGGWYIAKYSDDGTYIWGKQLSPAGLYSFSPSSIVIDPQNNIFISGADYRADSFNVAVVKLNQAGSQLWNFKLNHYGGHDTSPGLVFDGAGNFYTAGFFTATLDFDPGPGITTKTSMGMEDAFFAKYTDNTSTLPVTFLRFSGETQGKQNLLHWTTAMEQNNTGFGVQRSSTGNNFSSIGFVHTKALNGNSDINLDYDFIDNDPIATTNYYRLKQIDKDGKFRYSNIIVLRNNNSGSDQAVVYPNPARDIINVRIVSAGNRTITMFVTDLAGRTLLTEITTVSNGESIVQLNVAQLPAGIYFLKTISGDSKENAVKKFIKQ